MHVDLEALRAQRKTHWQAGQRLLDRAQAENRDLTATETREFDALTRNMDELDATISRIERVEEQRRVFDRAREMFDVGSGTADLSNGLREVALTRSMSPVDVAPDERRLVVPAAEARALSSDGHVPYGFWSQVWSSAVETSAVLRAGATVLTTDNGEGLSIPTSSADAVSEIVAEGAEIPLDDPDLHQLPLPVYKFASMVFVSNELVEDVGFDLAGFLAESAGRSIGRALRPYLINGTGQGQPAGVLTAATLGKTGTGPAPTDEDLIDLQASVLPEYANRPGSAWIMAPQTLAALRKVKADTSGNYLLPFGPGGPNAQAQLWGQQVYIDSAMAQVGAGAKSVLFGDVGSYVVRAAGGIRFEVSNDYRFRHDQTAFRVTARFGGGVADVSALKYFAGAAQ